MRWYQRHGVYRTRHRLKRSPRILADDLRVCVPRESQFDSHCRLGACCGGGPRDIGLQKIPTAVHPHRSEPLWLLAGGQKSRLPYSDQIALFISGTGNESTTLLFSDMIHLTSINLSNNQGSQSLPPSLPTRKPPSPPDNPPHSRHLSSLPNPRSQQPFWHSLITLNLC
jgi:hypothetical protein